VESYALAEAQKEGVVQFERVGFCRVFLKMGKIMANFGHK
jgi:hypothetical protein